MKAHIGTSGFSYAHWAHGFYEGVPQKSWLEYYASEFDTVELNNPFYRLPAPKMVRHWAEVTPPSFRFAVKAWRAITHYRRLKETKDVLKKFYRSIAPLEDKTSVILFQLHPQQKCDLERLESFLQDLSQDWRYAIEFRDHSWRQEAVYDLLRDHHIACCHSLWPGDITPRAITADFAYVRFHGTAEKYEGSHSTATLRSIARWLEQARIKEAHCYFNNTDRAESAIDNARTLRQMLAPAKRRRSA
jgi:uncharacterized protein YecE (DUF72 family)